MNNYTVKKDKEGKDLFKCKIEWTDTYGQPQMIETTSIELSQTLIGLLSGDICLANLEL